METTTPQILDPSGRPARHAPGHACPRCGNKKRVASAGFGQPHPVCGRCGHEWPDEPWDHDAEEGR